MTAVFIFAEQVRKILNQAKTEIEIPEGARISAAAADLIKDNQLRIKFISPQQTSMAETSQPAGQRIEGDSAAPEAARQETASDLVGGDTLSEVDAEINDEVLENIVNRVIERFKQHSGIAPAKPTPVSASLKSESEPADDDDIVICRCEEITKGEIKEAIRNGMRTLNGIKRITRAGMGLCQGQTCQRLVSQILAQELGLSLAEVEPTTARGPVRPLRLEVFANS
jgi:bacterioferritin-associated ferredoxin